MLHGNHAQANTGLIYHQRALDQWFPSQSPAKDHERTLQVHERHDPQEAVYLQSSLRLHAIHIKIILHFPRRLSPVDPPSFCFTCARREHSWTLPLSAVTKGLQVALHRQQEPQGVLHPQQQVPKEKGMWGKALRVR